MRENERDDPLEFTLEAVHALQLAPLAFYSDFFPGRDLPIVSAYPCLTIAGEMPMGHTRPALPPMNRPAEALQGIHVLVIDDDRGSRHFLRSVLELSGAVVTAAGTTDAIRAALIADVIVCDLPSAEMAGREFLAQLQRLHVRLGRTVPAIALVAAGTRSARVLAAGFQASLTKPIDGDGLRAAVLEGLRQ